MLSITTFESREALMRAAADRLAESLENALKTRGEACAALSGGSTPAPAYRLLAHHAGWDWSKVTFALVDERFVPPTDDASNEKMIRQTLAPALAQGARFKPMYAPAAAAAEAAARANALYDGLRIDVALMGMGEDGHTASWFPGSPDLRTALTQTHPPVLAVHAANAAGTASRLTLTQPAIAKAGRVILLITGANKRAVLGAALAGPVEAAPVAALFAGTPPEVLWAA